MSLEQVRLHLSRWNKDKDIIESGLSIATVELAAKALGVEPARIAKSISLRNSENDAAGSGAMMLVTAGDMKLDNKKFRAQFGFKPRMLSPGEVLALIGHAIGGVCPFALPSGVNVYLDNSLKRFATVFPATGNENSAIELTPAELAEYSLSSGWVDVCVIKN